MYYKLGTTTHANGKNEAKCIEKEEIIIKNHANTLISENKLKGAKVKDALPTIIKSRKHVNEQLTILNDKTKMAPILTRLGVLLDLYSDSTFNDAGFCECFSNFFLRFL